MPERPNIRLAMCLVVRDEADIIAHNIRFHSQMGVDVFLVTDNASVDGTREILEELKDDLDLHVWDEPRITGDHDLWLTRMAALARDDLGAQWVIPNDADELWLPSRGSLKTLARLDATVVTCPRVNMLAAAGSQDNGPRPFYENIIRIDPPIEPASGDELMKAPAKTRRIMPKVACQLEGLERIYFGSHEVEHAHAQKVTSDSVLIYHYPLRSFEQFQRKIRNHGEGNLANGRRGPLSSWHLRRWHEMLREGQLREAYDHHQVDREERDKLVREGFALIDYSVWASISPHTLPGTPSSEEIPIPATLEFTEPPLQLPRGTRDHHRNLLQAVVEGREYPLVQDLPTPSLIVDVGAHIGAFASCARQRYPRTPILCYEPSPRNLPLLRANLETLGNAELIPHGLHVTTRCLSLHLGTDGTGITDSVYPNSLSGEEQVPVTLLGALQHLAPRLTPGSLLKCDAEGVELAVIGCLGRFLDNIDLIYLEFHSEADRRRIDQEPSPRFSLVQCHSSQPHRGLCTYLRRSLLTGTDLEARCISTTTKGDRDSPPPLSEGLPAVREWYESFVWFTDTHWLGNPVLKHPCDLWVYQEIITRQRPQLIVECGTHMGGSARFLASICDQVGEGTVLTIDIRHIEGRPEHPRIIYLQGRSTDPHIVAEVHRRATGLSSVLVLLDSDHHADNVLAELRAYSDLVPVGGYLVVEDTVVNGQPVLPDFGPGPGEAVEAFLREDRNYERDRALEKFLITANPGGYLRRRA